MAAAEIDAEALGAAVVVEDPLVETQWIRRTGSRVRDGRESALSADKCQPAGRPKVIERDAYANVAIVNQDSIVVQ